MQVTNNNAAVLKSAGAINTHTTTTGIISGTNALLKSFITSCFLAIDLEIKMIKANLAKSDV
jgi:hypothetical protein